MKNISIQSEINTVDFSPDGKTIASGSEDGTICLWDAASGKNTQTLKGHTKGVTSVCFSPDGKTIASGSEDKTIRLWDAASGKFLNKLSEHTDRVTSVCFSPDGKKIASGSEDGTIRLWKWKANGEGLIHTLRIPISGVYSVRFSPDGKIIASGCWDNAIRLWDVSTGKLLRTLKKHTDRVTSVSFSPDGKIVASVARDKTIESFTSDGKIRATGYDDGTIRLYSKEDNYSKIKWTFIGGQKGNWMSINRENRVWRYDDGTLLIKKDENGRITPVLPPEPKEEGILDILYKPSALQTLDGESKKFSIRLKNNGKRRLYWINVIQDIDIENKNPLVFHPPSTRAILEPREEVEMKCKVSGFTSYENPEEKLSQLNLKITHAYGAPIYTKIPVEICIPRLNLIAVENDKNKKDLLLITLYNTGKQDLRGESVINATIRNKQVRQNIQLNLEAGARTPTLFSFNLPVVWFGERKLKNLNLTLTNANHPLHVWKFTAKNIILPAHQWYWYVLLGFLVLVTIISFYYLRFYRHPLVLQLSKSPETFTHLDPNELHHAKNLLKRAQRLKTVLSSVSITKSRLEQGISFFRDWDPEKRCHYIGELLDAKYESILKDEIHLFKFHLSRDFILNMNQCLVAFPNNEIPAHEILSRIKKVEGANYLVCVFISSNEEQHAELHKASLNLDNLFVTPESKELTHLLLSPNPLDVFASLIASQVKVTRISPYQIKTGVNKESIFFGREQLLAHIMQREPADYLLVGARQIGKSSLLKAIERRYSDHPSVECHYLVLEGNEITGHLARALKLPVNIHLPELLEHMSQGEEGKRWLFLIDEADKFIAAESQTGCATLKHFRSLSEKCKSNFIFAGFWDLYHAAVFDYQSPIKNFGEILSIEALEADACRQLATKPMVMLNIHYESNELVELLIHETGQRANLIAIICNEMLKKLDMTERLIRKEQLEEAFDSKAVISALSGWEMISSDETANRLDRIIVYATINKETFTQTELMRFLESKGVSYEAEQVKQSLERLELAFILKREKQNYSYRVPLFKKMVRQQDPEDLLGRELKAVH
ncbi:MAG: hypothetical protein GTN53_25910 [Candidatus Aminicenantes bacterium]|nr:hypothetical protein [Candidatus Aminicenantes bacterium]NIN24675.1 hypothetical protein [Candidatus Aminicenantes bacterium]NIT25944.1 hypothetical protein [Candidatus Aminicenantes bacterium]